MFRRALMSMVALFATVGLAHGAETSVAVAANFTAPAQEIAARFQAETGDTVKLSFASSGQILTEISNGAPYDIFLSADIDHAQKAEQAGLTVPGSRFTYATGHLVLWSENPSLVDVQGKILKQGNFSHISIADPKLAPYGLAAVQFLRGQGLWTAISPKVVTGKSIAQAYEFVKSGNADLGFVALSQVIGKREGSEWLVPDALHAPIIQQAVLLKPGAGNPAATEFFEFLKKPEAQAIILEYGYN